MTRARSRRGRRGARGRGDASPPTPAARGGAHLAPTLAAALAAHYAFESARPAHARRPAAAARRRASRRAALTEFRRNPFSGPPPPPNETAEQRRQREAFELACARAAQLQRRVADAVAGRDAGRRAGRHSRPAVPRPACAARRLFFDETNRGFLGRDVGYYDRTRSVHARLLVLRRRRVRQRARHQSSRRAELGPHRLPPHDRRRPALGVARALAAREHDRDRDRASRCPSASGRTSR